VDVTSDIQVAATIASLTLDADDASLSRRGAAREMARRPSSAAVFPEAVRATCDT